MDYGFQKIYSLLIKRLFVIKIFENKKMIDLIGDLFFKISTIGNCHLDNMSKWGIYLIISKLGLV